MTTSPNPSELFPEFGLIGSCSQIGLRVAWNHTTAGVLFDCDVLF
jgi:hypothetical protein